MEQLREEDNILNEENEIEEVKEEEVNIEILNEKMETIMQKLESLNVEKEIGEREKNRDVRLMIEKIELENFKSYAGVKRIGPLHHVNIVIKFFLSFNLFVLIRASMQLSVQMVAENQI
jgi:hypothetical protein